MRSRQIVALAAFTAVVAAGSVRLGHGLAGKRRRDRFIDQHPEALGEYQKGQQLVKLLVAAEQALKSGGDALPLIDQARDTLSRTELGRLAQGDLALAACPSY